MLGSIVDLAPGKGGGARGGEMLTALRPRIGRVMSERSRRGTSQRKLP